MKALDDVINAANQYHTAKADYCDVNQKFLKQQRLEIDDAGLEWEKGNNEPAEQVKREHEIVAKLNSVALAKLRQV